MKNIKRKGFTLVELLIVIVVIGVLSAMMMISSTSAVSSAQASQIVANLRAIKVATLAWYADNLNTTTGPSMADVTPYIGGGVASSGGSGTPFDGYTLEGTSALTTDWYVQYEGLSLSNSDVQKKLAKLAESNPDLLSSAGSAVYTVDDTVRMLIRKNQ